MNNSFRLRLNYLVLISIVFLFSNLTNAQPNTSKAIDVNLGYGVSFPNDNIEIYGNGFYLQGEYVLPLTSWFGLRPYTGVLMTWPEKDNMLTNMRNYKVSSKAFLLGAKARLVAPIPWVAPYVESGYGASIGTFETFTPYTAIEKSGIVAHIPLTPGLILGPDRNFDFAFSYYYYPAVEQVSGALAIGLSIALNKNK